MTHDSTSHRIFKISELTRLIATELIPIGQKSAVNLACACRYLEEPVLSTLWETQHLVHVLLEVLPEGAWDYTRLEPGRKIVRDLDPVGEIERLNLRQFQFRIVGNPSPEAWSRVHRYASWMHRIHVDEWVSPLQDGTLRQLRLNSPTNSRWFPALRYLSWCFTKHNTSYADLFFSPHLEKVSIFMSSAWKGSEIPYDLLPAIASTISALPGPNLRDLFISMEDHMVPWEYFEESLSSVVLRCGSSLTDFISPIPLSDAALNHLIHLPHLRIWYLEGLPPNYHVSPLPLTFPPLTDLTLGEGAYGWLSLFGRLEDCAFATRGVTPLFRVKESLETLNFPDLSGPITDFSFASPVQVFRNLRCLNVNDLCPEGDDGRCIFKLNNDDVTKLAMALSQLEYLHLGHPCFANTCATTVSCLLPISVYCVKLGSLGIHFNTTNIIEDLENISEDPRFQELRSLPRCSLSYLDVYLMPLPLDDSDLETMARGFIEILPSLKHCEGRDNMWGEFCDTLENLVAPEHHQ